MDPTVFVLDTPGACGAPEKVDVRDGGPGTYGPDVGCGAKDVCNGLPYCCACWWSLYAAALRPVPSAASGGGGVFSRWAMGSGAAGAAGLYAIGTKLLCASPAGGLDVGAGAVGGPGKDGWVLRLRLGLRLECDMAARSSFATTGFIESVLYSGCAGAT